MHTTAGTTSSRWARVAASGWSARQTVPSPSAATANCCASLRRPELLAAALIAALALVAGWNAYRYPSGAGYDVAQHRQYADLLIHHGEIPAKGTHTEYYTPPGFYALAGAATVIGEHVHAGDPYKLGQVLNWLVLLAAAGVLWLLARELFPGRVWLQLSSLAYFCFLPVVLRVGAMFHPEPLSMLLTAVALLLAARLLRRHDYRWQVAAATGVVLGLGQLVRAFSLWTFAAVVLAFAAARAWRPLAVAGWLLLLARSLRSPPRLAVALLPGLGLLGYLYFTVSYPTPDGDVLKASYMLTTAPAWALAFGYAVDRLPGRLRIVLAALLAASALATLPFLLY